MPRKNKKYNLIEGDKNASNMLTGTDGMDAIAGGDNVDFLNGGGGNDYLFGGAGSDFLNGGDGDDTLDGGEGFDHLFGGAGNDVFYGSKGQDIMRGEEGNDTFRMTNEDIAEGGSGADRFIWKVRENQSISISDFDASEGDSISLWGGRRLDYDLIESDNATTVAFENGAEVTFFGITTEEIEMDPGLFGL